MNVRLFARDCFYLVVVIAISLLMARFSRGHSLLVLWPFGAGFGLYCVGCFGEFIRLIRRRGIERFTGLLDSIVYGAIATKLLALAFDVPVADRVSAPVLVILIASRFVYHLALSRSAASEDAAGELRRHLIRNLFASSGENQITKRRRIVWTLVPFLLLAVGWYVYVVWAKPGAERRLMERRKAETRMLESNQSPNRLKV